MIRCNFTTEKLSPDEVANEFRRLEGKTYNTMCRHQNQALAQKYNDNRVL